MGIDGLDIGGAMIEMISSICVFPALLSVHYTFLSNGASTLLLAHMLPLHSRDKDDWHTDIGKRRYLGQT